MKARALLLLCSLILLFCAAVSSFAQPLPNGKRFELSLSGAWQRFTDASSGGSSHGSSLFYISPRLGYFVVQGLEVEPEFTGIFAGGGDPGYAFNGNLSYNFPIRGKSLIFVLAGYGVGNGVPLATGLASFSQSTLGILNLGAGVKALLSDDIAIRTEVRYQRFTGSRVYPNWYLGGGTFGPYSVDYDLRLTSVQFGIAIFP